jgi:hypothetical protein
MAKKADSLAAGQELAQALAGGWQPTPIPAPFHLPAGEACYASHPVQVLQMLEGDGTYLHKTRFAFSPLGVAVATATMAGNSARKRRAAREAEARFRPVDRGTLHVTNHRLAIQGEGQWTDLYYADIRMSYCDNDALTLELSNMPAIRLRAWPAYAIFGLFRYLAHGEIVQL